MLTREQEILLRLETTEGSHAAGVAPNNLAVADGVTALSVDFTPNIEYLESDIASGSLDTAAADVGIESAQINFGAYLRGAGINTVPEFDSAIRMCGMTREALAYYVLDADQDGGAFIHGEGLAICEPTALTVTDATAASSCVLTTSASHGVPVGAKVPVVITDLAFPSVPDLDNSLVGGWPEAESLTTTTLRLTGVDTSDGSNQTSLTASLYIPPVATNAQITVTVGSPTTIRLLAASGIEDYVTGVGDQIYLEIDGEATVTGINGRHLATVSAVSAGVHVDVTIDVETSGTPSGTKTIFMIPQASVCGEYSEVADDQKLFVFAEYGKADEDMVLGGFGSKATATVDSSTDRTAGGYRYRPVGERTFTMTLTGSWTTANPAVGSIIKRRNSCGAYGRVITVSSDYQTIVYEPYGDAFAAADGVEIVGTAGTNTVSTVAVSGSPSGTIEGRFGGVIYAYVGARGTFTVNLQVGQPWRIDFEMQGLKGRNPVDSVLAGVSTSEEGKIRHLQGFNLTRDLSGNKACDYKYDIESASIALNRTPTQKPDATTASGVLAYRHQEEYTPEVTMDPSMTPVGVHAWYEFASSGTLKRQIFGAGSSEGNRVVVDCPKVQYGAGGFGDRNGERTVDFTGFCRRDQGNDAVQIFVY